ncbi:hypothetical protein A2592_02470 [Candidatus Kaiserbacteria bacterium RIFOXYD1_FULL_42_15]|uniref:Isoleucine--tRNA ligase n=1 Tax=Candidatus Kaiserbacteria bacterium RIFOXYD1_FULL_42_15 TaxID=1798532 RepID=A0A1F6FPP3_9BACT|nr:MAG: hypothetical protein A2592_02470 [Candidatus Kaiserbacteria bacterium RIFOXYD1_FULL_42_15]
MNKQHGRENDSVAVTPEVEKSDVALREEVIQQFWKDNDIFNKSLSKPAGADPKGDFVFYDGPPFATGTPHYGHILAGTIKDAIPRFWTMQGYHVPRKWGWDCHGLPLENLIEKKLGLGTKRDIEAFGVKNFNETARSAVLEYADYWGKVVPRMGRWADMESDYRTMDSTYTESVWWVFKSLHDKGLVFEGFKSMHLCPRCGTTLSNFEVNQGYKDIKDIAVTVKLPLLDEQGKITDTSLLVWTTTPWTLPGNMATAVHNDVEYTKVKIRSSDDRILDECVILAKERLAQLGDIPYEVVEEFKGSALVGKSFQPPFDYWLKQDFAGKEKAWKIYHADYVEVGAEGTGAVHLAPAYGDDDMTLAKVHGVPIVHHVNPDGHFMDFVIDFAGQLVKPKDDEASEVSHLDADIEIVKALNASGRLFKKENITHSYPHCWRCDTPLLNYATTSWFVNVPKIKDELVTENNKVNWVPEYVGRARFGNWLEGARDWAVSRQRYWGAPLPIWKNPTTGEYKVIGSLVDLQQYVPKSGNTYLLMRHGETESNVKGVISSHPDSRDSLTQKGQEQIKASIADIGKIDLIIHSGFERTRQTAELLSENLGEIDIIADQRIGELQAGDILEGKTWDKYNEQFPTWKDRYEMVIPNTENRRDVQVRMGKFLFELEQTYKNKRILIISHAGPLFALESAARGLNPEGAKDYYDTLKNMYFNNSEIRELNFTPFPHNYNLELDYHRPYIDEIDLFDTDGTKLERVPDVFDCWFESGSMPYGQHHYPFENKEEFEKNLFPAQFIAEGLDQTRGWFYSLIVLGTALFGKSPYQNVIVNGLVLAEDGKKMSKSLKNYPDPMELVDRMGADAMRLYLMTSPVIRGEDLNFSEKEVLELQRKNIGRLHNVLAMYEMFADGTEAHKNSTHILDRWIMARLNELTASSTAGYKSYELDKATRPIIDFIDDLSVWYLRRSRDRFKGSDESDRTAALGTLRYILRELAKVIAPAMPFYAEYLWLVVRSESEPESVHLTAWPEGGEVDEMLLEEMKKARQIVTLALEARVKANLKVRQPLQSISGPKLSAEIVDTVLGEVNAKEYKIINSPSTEEFLVQIDTEITPALKAEGDAREFIRAIQEQRKASGFAPQDRIILTVEVNEVGESLIKKFMSEIQKVTGTEVFIFGTNKGVKISAGESTFVVLLQRK